jgi:Calcineurin-like phosphoesterase
MSNKEDKPGKKPDNPTKCAEHGVWTAAPKAPPANQKPLDFSAIDADENKRIISSGKMSFAMVGCSGDPDDGTQTKAVAHAIAADDSTSFFYHLGDIIYFEKGSDATTDSSQATDTPELWNSQFYGPYKKYPKQIVSIPGNHDGKSTPITNFFDVFCSDPSKWPAPWSENTIDKRPAMIQPYVYWRLNTPLAYIIGLFSNIANGGILDDPTKYSDFTKGPQYQWLVGELKAVAAANSKNSPKKAVLLMVHYPPYSGTANFNVRGDPSKGPGPSVSNAPYLSVALQKAFTDSGERPDAIFSAHAHLFQRLTYSFADGSVMPCLVAGCGGHAPMELLAEECDGSKGDKKKVPFPAVTPGSFKFPKGDSAQVEYFEDGHKDDSEFGYLRVTLKGRTLKGEFIGAKSGQTLDRFKLDLDKHKYQ